MCFSKVVRQTGENYVTERLAKRQTSELLQNRQKDKLLDAYRHAYSLDSQTDDHRQTQTDVDRHITVDTNRCGPTDDTDIHEQMWTDR